MYIASTGPDTAVRLGPQYGTVAVSLDGTPLQTAPLTERVLTVGRLPENELVLPDPSVSRHHAEIRVEPTGPVITDLGSAGGTFVNDVRAAPHQPFALEPGAVVRIGPYTLEYLPPPPPPPPPPPAGAGRGSPPVVARPTPPWAGAFPPAGPWPAAGPGDPGEAPRRRPSRVPVAIVGVLAVIALLVGLVAVVRGDDEPDVPAASEEDAADSPTATTVPPDPPTEAELRAVVDEVSAFVEEERGLAFEEPVAAELVADEEFERRALEDFEEEVPSFETAGVVLAALGLVDPDLDVVEAIRSLTAAGVVGFYDPESGELVVRGAALTPYVRTVMAHELTHALDDQHFELDRPELDEAADESGFGFLSVVEGNARRVETAYRDTLSDEESRQALAEELALASGIDITSIPFVLVEQMSAPYELGQDFVDALLEAGGQEQLDAALGAPPTTSEQVLDPEAYLAGEGAVEVPLPEVAGDIVDDGTLGQFLIAGVLGGALDDDEVTVATDGWGGDRVVAWRDRGRPCVTASVVGDTPEDTAELQAAFEDWATARDDAAVDAGATPDAPFTLRACA